MKHSKSNTAEKVPLTREEKKKKKLVFCIVIGVLVCVMLFSGYKIAKTLLQYHAGEKSYSGAADEFVNVVEPGTESQGQSTGGSKKGTNKDAEEKQEEEDAVPISVDMEKLRASWPNAVGWLYCADTVINYPVMQSHEDNLYYVEHLFNDEWNPGGAIFLDFRNDGVFGDRNNVLYGHHMNDGSMFASLVKYAKDGYYAQHPTLWLATPDGTYRLDVFAGYVTPATSETYDRNFDSEEEFASWLESCVSRSNFTANVTPKTTDRILTLSTCTYDYDNARYVVQAILIPVEAE